MNDPASPGLTHFPAQEPRDLTPGAILREPLGNERLQQILDAVCYDTSFCLPLLGCRIAAFELRREHPLGRHARLMKGQAPIRPDGVLAQLRAGTACSVKNDEHLAAIWRHLDAEARTPAVPIHYVRFGSRQRVDRALGQSDAWHGRNHPLSRATLTSHR